MKFRWALAIELIGVALAVVCSLTVLPVVSTRTGTATTILWGPQPSDICPCTYDHTVAIDVGTSSDWDFDFTGATIPAGPGPYVGQTVEVDYLDTAQGWKVLSVVAGPPAPESARYDTPDGVEFEREQPLHYATLAGLLLGLLLTCLGASLVIYTVRRQGARAGAVAAAFAPMSVFALIPLVGLWLGAPALAITTQVGALAWILCSLIALGAGLAGRGEQPGEFARNSLKFVGVTNGIWILWWVGGGLYALSHAMF